jgi:hypothetical protein
MWQTNSFKMFVESENSLLKMLSKVNAEDFYQDPHTTSFIYLENGDKLFCGIGKETHADMLREQLGYMTWGEVLRPITYNKTELAQNSPDETRATFGRIGYLDKHRYNNDNEILSNIRDEYPDIGIVAMWDHWSNLVNTPELIHKTVKKLLNATKGTYKGFSPIMLPINKNYYVVSMGVLSPFQISGKQGENDINTNELNRMAGELHFLPHGSPRIREIENMALKLKSMPDSAKYKWFIDKVLSRNISTKHPLQQSMEKEKIINPGQKFWSIHGENFMN